MISVMFVGHLGELALSGASMATSFASITGFSLLKNGSALDTLCCQSYGTKQYHMLGIHMQRAMFVLLLACIPLVFIWANMGPILMAVGQDPDILAEAGLYARFMIPSIFAYALLQCHVGFLQTQNIVFPMMITSGITTLLHILICWILVFKSGLGNRGAAVANSISYWINVLLLALYVKFSPTCTKTWTGFSMEALHDVLNFIRLAIPSAVMVRLEKLSFEMMVLLSGLLPNPKLETSVLSISLKTTAVVWMVPFGLSSTVSNEVVKYVAMMMPVLAVSIFLDRIQCVLSGTARGCGWPKIGAFVNLGAYYLVGIPSAILLAFVFHFGGRVNIHPCVLLSYSFGCAEMKFIYFADKIVAYRDSGGGSYAKKATDRIYGPIIPVGMASLS
ncbi:hypothetical protein HHK36_006869 [Tetracentron sinense]|uniref:Uncharacterized protein n=1 Tax=Tetracentron sinense TaxID=13715 RepID=A0A835DPH1_TETSI|nr:hypothetical protein HHK36_006869 [Tetracentron sinense]